MKSIVQLLGLLFILLGIYTLFFTKSVFGFLEENIENQSLYLTAIIIRIVLGVLLIVAARASIYPTAIKVIGYVAIIAAIVLIIIGQEGFQNFMIHIIPDFKPYAKIAGLVIIAFGGFLLYAFIAKKNNHK